MTEQETQELTALEADYDHVAAILEDEESEEDEIAKAEKELLVIDQAIRALNERTAVLPEELKPEAGAFLVLSRSGEPQLVPQFYTNVVLSDEGEGAIEAVAEEGQAKPKSSTLSQRLLDELAMQRRDILVVHLAKDPDLALDFMVFTLADVDQHDWRAKRASTLVGSIAAGPDPCSVVYSGNDECPILPRAAMPLSFRGRCFAFLCCAPLSTCRKMVSMPPPRSSRLCIQG